jgi:hypothetical protein
MLFVGKQTVLRGLPKILNRTQSQGTGKVQAFVWCTVGDGTLELSAISQAGPGPRIGLCGLCILGLPIFSSIVSKFWTFSDTGTQGAVNRLCCRHSGVIMSEKTFSETRAEPVHKLQKIAGTGRVSAMPSTQSQPSRPGIPTSRPSGAQGTTLVIPLIIPSQTQPDPSDLPEHIDRYSPCSMLEEERWLILYKASSIEVTCARTNCILHYWMAWARQTEAFCTYENGEPFTASTGEHNYAWLSAQTLKNDLTSSKYL